LVFRPTVRLTFVIEACGAAELAYEGVVIRSFVFSEGKLAGQDLDLDALRLVRSDKGLIIWIDLENPTDQETRDVLERAFGVSPIILMFLTDGKGAHAKTRRREAKEEGGFP
jgi:Mg2+ and Co2+ transporter CorA